VFQNIEAEWQNVLTRNYKISQNATRISISLHNEIMKYSRQISELFFNRLYKNIKNTGRENRKNAMARKLFFTFIEMSSTTDRMSLPFYS